MAYVDIYAAATDSDSVLVKQITVAMFKSAANIINEDPLTENHANRIGWARKVTDSPAALLADASRWSWKVLENATIQTNPTTSPDNDIQFVVDSILHYIVQR
jgi:hypothetical protein